MISYMINIYDKYIYFSHKSKYKQWHTYTVAPPRKQRFAPPPLNNEGISSTPHKHTHTQGCTTSGPSQRSIKSQVLRSHS